MNLKENWMYSVLVQSRSRDTSMRMPSYMKTHIGIFIFLTRNRPGVRLM